MLGGTRGFLFFLFDMHDYGETIKHTELFSDFIKNMSWEDEPVEL